MLTKDDLIETLEKYKQHVNHYHKEFTQKNRQPKNYDWRPYRWCSRDIVFSLMVVRHKRQGNYLEADVCLIADPPQYLDNSGARVALGFLLSEAFRCGGTMEIVFSKNVEGGRVPSYICDLAIEMGIKLKHVFEGHITPYEARQLYIELIGFSDQAKTRIMQLSVEGKISPEHTCFVVLGGVWTVAEVETIILGCAHPEAILSSLSHPEDRHFYLDSLAITRNAVLGGVLDRKLLRAELAENGLIIESEDEQANINIDFDPAFFAKIYQAEAGLIIPWIGENDISLRPGQSMVVMVRARSDSEIQRYFLSDLKSLQALIVKYRKTNLQTMIFYLTPRDFEDVSSEQQSQIVSLLEQNGVYLMISPESLSGLNKEAIRRLETGRLIRQ